MKQRLSDLAMWSVILGLVLGAGACGALVAGCQSAPATSPADQANVAAYAAQLQQCVALAPTKAAAETCLGAVRASFCGPGGYLAEAGACTYEGGVAVVPPAVDASPSVPFPQPEAGPAPVAPAPVDAGGA